MGTHCYPSTRANAITEELRNVGSGLIKHKAIGSTIWYLAQGTTQDGRTIKYIGLILLRMHKGEACVKHMDESCGPCYYNCPLAYLAEASAVESSFAVGWREKVRAHHAALKAKTHLTTGAVVTYGGNDYTLQVNLGRKGWECTRGGMTYRMRAHQVRSAALKQQPAQ